MELNYLLIACIVILLACIIRGAHRGMLRIVFGVVGWIFIICFINYSSDYVTSYISDNTKVPTVVQEHITTHLTDKYNTSEEKEAGTGEDAVMQVVPNYIKEKVTETVQSSIEATINFISQELTTAAIKGIATIVSIVAAILFLFILDKIIKAIGLVPGIKDVNRLLGIIAGVAEGMLIIWLLMYIASCFPASTLGEFVIKNAEKDQLVYFIYQNNLIARIIGI